MRSTSPSRSSHADERRFVLECARRTGMDDRARLLKTWENEDAMTRKVLSRIPEGSSYRPDPKSRTAREIAWLIVQEEAALADGLARGVFEWREVPAPAT